MLEIRPFRDGDEGCLDGLLDAASDPLWRNQGHRLHGPDRDGAIWRRTVIAEDDGLVVGAGTVAANAVHPTRYNAAVEVAPDRRRRGIGTALLSALRRLRPEPLPLAGKVRERDVAARAFVTFSGGRPYQRCRCPRLTLDEPVATWCRDRVHVNAVAPFGSTGEMMDPFAAMYRWLHESWSPVGDDVALRDVASRTCDEADLALSRVARIDGVPVALALAFRDGDHADVVAETVAFDVANGTDILAAAIAAVLAAAARAGVTTVEFELLVELR